MKRGSVCKPSTGLSPAAISSCSRPCQEKQTAPGHTEWTQCRKTGDVPTLFIFDASTAHYEPQRRRLNFCSKIQISVDFLTSSKNKQADLSSMWKGMSKASDWLTVFCWDQYFLSVYRKLGYMFRLWLEELGQICSYTFKIYPKGCC